MLNMFYWKSVFVILTSPLKDSILITRPLFKNNGKLNVCITLYTSESGFKTVKYCKVSVKPRLENDESLIDR